MSTLLLVLAALLVLWIPLAYIVVHRDDSSLPVSATSTNSGAVAQNALRQQHSSSKSILLETLDEKPGVKKEDVLASADNFREPVDERKPPMLARDSPTLQFMEFLKSRPRPSLDIRSPDSFKINTSLGVSWKEFVSTPLRPHNAKSDIYIAPGVNLVQCSKEVNEELTKPILPKEDYEWCEWALSSSGGKVKVPVSLTYCIRK
jgi:hypothetical protein